MRLTRVDLPTFGRPTTASTGCPCVPNPALPSAPASAPSNSVPPYPATSRSSPTSTQPSSPASMSANLTRPLRAVFFQGDEPPRSPRCREVTPLLSCPALTARVSRACHRAFALMPVPGPPRHLGAVRDKEVKTALLRQPGDLPDHL